MTQLLAYETFGGEIIKVGSIVETEVRLPPSQHRGWGAVEALYPATEVRVAQARVRDIDGHVENIDLPILRLHHKYGGITLESE